MGLNLQENRFGIEKRGFWSFYSLWYYPLNPRVEKRKGKFRIAHVKQWKVIRRNIIINNN